MWNLVSPWIHCSGSTGWDDVLPHRLAQMAVVNVRGALGGQHHRIHRGYPAVLVAHRHLALGVGPQPRQDFLLANLRMPLHQAVGMGDGQRHQNLGLVGGIAEHQPLIPGPLFFGPLPVHALGDVAGLLADQGHHLVGAVAEAHIRAGVADVADHAPDQFVQVDPSIRRDLAACNGGSGLDHRLTDDADTLRIGILFQNGIQNRIEDLVHDFVQVPLGNRLRGEEIAISCRQRFLVSCSKGQLGTSNRAKTPQPSSHSPPQPPTDTRSDSHCSTQGQGSDPLDIHRHHDRIARFDGLGVLPFAPSGAEEAAAGLGGDHRAVAQTM